MPTTFAAEKLRSPSQSPQHPEQWHLLCRLILPYTPFGLLLGQRTAILALVIEVVVSVFVVVVVPLCSRSSGLLLLWLLRLCRSFCGGRFLCWLRLRGLLWLSDCLKLRSRRLCDLLWLSDCLWLRDLRLCGRRLCGRRLCSCLRLRCLLNSIRNGLLFLLDGILNDILFLLNGIRNGLLFLLNGIRNGLLFLLNGLLFLFN